VAGKTGTAQKIDPVTRRYSSTKYVASFCGFAPVSHPRITVVVVVDEPTGMEWGGTNAGPIFRSVAWQVLSLLGVPPDAGAQLVLKPETGEPNL
jgi:cell division protein FtsI (penicillin-binding protein 3)